MKRQNRMRLFFSPPIRAEDGTYGHFEPVVHAKGGVYDGRAEVGSGSAERHYAFQHINTKELLV